MCRHAAPGTFGNSTPNDLFFRGRIQIEVEDVWNDERTRGTRLDGEIFSRISIYTKVGSAASKAFVGEQVRKNQRAILLTPEIVSSGGLPFLSMAKEFEGFSDVVDWIYGGPLIDDGQLRTLFASELERRRARVLSTACKLLWKRSWNYRGLPKLLAATEGACQELSSLAPIRDQEEWLKERWPLDIEPDPWLLGDLARTRYAIGYLLALYELDSSHGHRQIDERELDPESEEARMIYWARYVWDKHIRKGPLYR